MLQAGAIGRLRLTLSLGIASGFLFFQGCTTPADPQPEAEPAAPSVAVPPVLSINAVMVGVVDHASHEIWNAAVAQTAPKTDEDWYHLQHHAIQVAAAGSVIALGGTGAPDNAWVQNAEWKRYSQELADAGVAALEAARNKSAQGISDAGDKLVMTCEGCHKVYKGDLPSEGIVHQH